MTLIQFQDLIMDWADTIWIERQEEANKNFDLDVADQLDERPDLSEHGLGLDANPAPAGEFYEDSVLETLKD